jgi:hypothetical protein
MIEKVKQIHTECDVSLAEDRSLPNNSYLVIYIKDNVKKYDIVMSNKMVAVFDEYWDEYKDNLIGITYTAGRVAPRNWGIEPKEKKK